MTSNRREGLKKLGMNGRALPVPLLVANPDPPIKNALGSVLDPITIIILKRVIKSILA